ncbi:MAG: class I SAM-dependent methyltransferase [Kiritimatiellae bacterium]|nr:class I SAM-dependent methyltransferase [Kiritimatiellia bacterium]
MTKQNAVTFLAPLPSKRFPFGRNWKSFLKKLGPSSIEAAEKSLCEMLDMDKLTGKKFLDIGSGSGLFSLAARRLGAKVTSFDFDSDSVACTLALRQSYFPDDLNWSVLKGSILDPEFVASLGRFDIVYAWGVLHHTGRLWTAMDNALALVGEGGIFFVAIYNDAKWKSRLWLGVKRWYCSGAIGRMTVLAIFVPYFFCRTALASLVRFRNEFVAYRRNRGMSVFHDWIDWLGGFPYEFASSNKVIEYCAFRGFRLRKLRAVKGIGNNQFVFERAGAASHGSL